MTQVKTPSHISNINSKSVDAASVKAVTNNMQSIADAFKSGAYPYKTKISKAEYEKK